MSETIKAISIIAWLRFRFMPACQADHKDVLKFKNTEEAIKNDPFNDIDNILLNLEEELMKQLTNEFHEKVIRPSGIESEYLYLKEDP